MGRPREQATARGMSGAVVNDALVAEIAKNSRESVRVTLGEYEGHVFVGMRIWVPGREGGEVPTKQGVTLNPSKIPELIAALQRALRILNGEGSA